MDLSEAASVLLILVASFFFLTGTVGLLRFPDVYMRIHALTKADTVGLGLLVAGLTLQAESWAAAGKLLLIWLLAAFASASIGHLVTHSALQQGVEPWRRR